MWKTDDLCSYSIILRYVLNVYVKKSLSFFFFFLFSSLLSSSFSLAYVRLFFCLLSMCSLQSMFSYFIISFTDFLAFYPFELRVLFVEHELLVFIVFVQNIRNRFYVFFFSFLFWRFHFLNVYLLFFLSKKKKYVTGR